MTSETIFKVVNDRYSTEQICGTWKELQQSFDDIGWSVYLVYERGQLFDQMTGELVAIPE